MELKNLCFKVEAIFVIYVCGLRDKYNETSTNVVSTNPYKSLTLHYNYFIWCGE